MSPKSILLVENDINLRQSIALILKRASYAVTATDCVDLALELLQSGNYTLLISDMNLPETSDRLLPMIAHEYPSISIVILTDQSNAEAESESRRFNAEYLLKPVAPESLLEHVGSILSREQSSHQSAAYGLPAERV